MDYKEKYEQALERAKTLQKTCDSQAIVGWCEYIFPELKESEDEKIRKELIFYLGDMPEDTELRNGVTNRDVLVWLEKQGKQKPYWSEEDEERLKSCLNILQAKGLMGVTDTINSNWLKSLKDRCTWKPSEEQLDALKRTQTGVIQFGVLQSLYNDLKKL